MGRLVSLIGAGKASLPPCGVGGCAAKMFHVKHPAPPPQLQERLCSRGPGVLGA